MEAGFDDCGSQLITHRQKRGKKKWFHLQVVVGREGLGKVKNQATLKFLDGGVEKKDFTGRKL